MNSATLTISGGRLIHSGNVVPGFAVVARGRVISHVGVLPEERPRQGRVIDARGCYVSPGFIDPHAHGAAGADFLSADGEAALLIAKAHARYGTTALFATVRSGPREAMAQAVECLGGMIRGGTAEGIIGIHLEGPFLNPARAGIHPAEHLRPPDRRELEDLLDGAEGCPLIMTLAPELPGALDLIGVIRARGGIPALGHSNADYRTAREAFDAGALYVTHLFNAMSGMHHRNPGLAGAALSDDRVAVELIADGVHVHPQVVKMALKLKGRDGIILVTDCMQSLDAANPEFTVGGRRVALRDGTPAMDDGTLCGSVLTMRGALRNVRKWTGALPEDVVAYATATPARVIGFGGRKGGLAPGMDADVVVFDEEFEIKATVIGGEVVCAAPGFPTG
jgi:N-acetylglucosamine-6-phosphate deacetylase